MKKFFIMLIAMTGVFPVFDTVSAQTRTKISDGIYLVNYGGSVFGIENDKTQQCISLSITQEKKSNGSVVYNILCENKITKGLVKAGLGGGIKSILTVAGQPWLTPFVGVIANEIYDSACNYFGE